MRRTVRVAAFLAGLVLLCTLPARAEKIRLSNDVAWCRASEAYRCCVEQAYLNAMRRLRELAKGEKPGRWCVVLDADETIISNVPFQAGLQASGEEYSKERWNVWCESEKSAALPGAREFCELVRTLGGKIIIVTNRKNPPLGGATRANLEKQGIPFDAVLLREGPYARDHSKKMRREDVEKGRVRTLPGGKALPPLKILMRVGDQTHDLYDTETLSFDDVKKRFGEDLVIVPNPMYGPWTKGEEASVEAKGRKAAPRARSSDALTWEEAMRRVGSEVVVEGKIVKVYIPSYGPPKLNFSRPWWKGLTVVVFNREKFGDLSKYEGKVVRVSGRVSTYTDRNERTSVQIKVEEPSQIEIVE